MIHIVYQVILYSRYVTRHNMWILILPLFISDTIANMIYGLFNTTYTGYTDIWDSRNYFYTMQWRILRV